MMQSTDEKRRRVEGMFDRIAPTYDKLNHLLSFNIDRAWRRNLVSLASRSCPRRILDVATGTGDVAIALARRIEGAEITGVDISRNMIECARRKVALAGLSEKIHLIEGQSESLDFGNVSFDLVTVAFGVRNFADMGKGLEEMSRVLRPKGECLVLEFSKPHGRLFAAAYRLYFHRILPFVGRLVSRDGAAYDYLPDSVDNFPAPADFEAMMLGAGFSDVHRISLTNGVAYIYIGVK